jgi:hypothetical protein
MRAIFSPITAVTREQYYPMVIECIVFQREEDRGACLLFCLGACGSTPNDTQARDPEPPGVCFIVINIDDAHVHVSLLFMPACYRRRNSATVYPIVSMWL